jgi:hypothetical protein
MDNTIASTDDRILNRRSTLKALFGLAAVAVGATAILTTGAAEAAPLVPKAPKEPEMAKDSELPESEPTQYYYRRRRRVFVRRRYYYRPRRVYRRRYIRRRYW